MNESGKDIGPARTECEQAQEECQREQQGVPFRKADFNLLSNKDVGDRDGRDC
jgi:hypothetical protein